MSKFEMFVLAYLTVQTALAIYAFWPSKREKALTETGETSPVGYKQAVLRFNESRPFAGVSGHANGYGVDEDAANSNGFHSFYSLDDALAHHQKGNVLLEVLNSGNVTFHTAGAESRHQRVLQVIMDKCTADDKQATAWAPWLDGSIHPVCDECAQTVGAKPLSELEAWLNASASLPLVVSTLKPTKLGAKFLPTIVTSKGTMEKE